MQKNLRLFRKHEVTVIAQDVNGRVFEVYFRRIYRPAENPAVISAVFQILRLYSTPMVGFLIFLLKNSTPGTGSLHVSGGFDIVW